MIIRPSTAEDVALFYPEKPLLSMRSWVVEYEGKVAAIAGVYFERGQAPQLFSNQIEGHGASKLTIWRATKGLLAHVLKHYPRPWAISTRGESSDRLLEFFGFEYLQDHELGKVYYRYNV